MAVRDLPSDEQIHEGGVKVFEDYDTKVSEAKAGAFDGGAECI